MESIDKSSIDKSSNYAHEAVDKVASATDRTSNYAHEAVDKIASATKTAADALGVKGEQLKNAEKQFMENCRVYARENPMRAVGIAVATGFILSRLLSSR